MPQRDARFECRQCVHRDGRDATEGDVRVRNKVRG
jgi:hypothetical protein